MSWLLIIWLNSTLYFERFPNETSCRYAEAKINDLAGQSKIWTDCFEDTVEESTTTTTAEPDK